MPNDLMIGDLPAALVGAMGGNGARKALEALKAAGWTLTHPDEPNGLHAFLDASTAHITCEDDVMLTRWAGAENDPCGSAPYRTIEHSYGYFVHVNLNDLADRAECEAQAREDGASDAFFKLQEYARERGCWWINLDRDADTVEGLPTHEW
jgi:hypothetical protein